MARLIVEEGGKTRRFRLNEGKLTIGSGAGATLTLESDALAEVHAELEFTDGEAVLHLRQGVTPALVQGRKISGSVKMRPGMAVKLGDAKLVVEADDAPQKPKTAAAVATAAGGAGGSRPRVQRTVKHHGKSMPAWAIVLIALVVVGIGYKMFESYSADATERGFSSKACEHRIQVAIANESFNGIFEELELVDAHKDQLEPEWAAKFEAHRKTAERMKSEAELMAANVEGNSYWETQLKGFVDKRLATAKRPEARVLMNRIEFFRTSWPKHPQISWCNRMGERYGPVAALHEPATYDDMAFEVKTLTWAMPRDYVKGFALLNDFIATADAGDRDKALALMDEKEGEREEYFDDRMQQAAYLWENKQYGQAVEWLVQIVIKIGDEDMANDAAERIAASPGVETALKGYRNDRRDVFDALMRNSIVRAFAEEEGIL